jgi:hypothetical protein
LLIFAVEIFGNIDNELVQVGAERVMSLAGVGADRVMVDAGKLTLPLFPPDHFLAM